jgi:hypothetical protein
LSALNNYGDKMKNSIRYAAAFATVLMLNGTGSLPLQAQELAPSHVKASKSALAASGATDQFDRILPAVADKVKSDIISNRPDLADAVSLIVDEETLKLAPRRGDLENESATIYGRVFNEQELKEIETFYSSSAGQKLLKEAPVITRELNNASKLWGSGIVRDLNEAVKKRMKEQGID